MPEPQSRPTWRSFNSSELGEQVHHLRDSARRQHFVTFLVGSGFSVTAGVPSAATIVKELREHKDGNALLEQAKLKVNTPEADRLWDAGVSV
jgi:hypothetical protein